jgi:hypothetical protein
MLNKNKNWCDVYIGSELLSDSAGTPRQRRQINNYNKNCIPLYVITISDSRWRLFSFSEFQMQAIEVNHSRKRGSKNLVIGLLRFFKQDLMLEFFTLRALQLYLILIKLYLSRNVQSTYLSAPPFPGFGLVLAALGMRFQIDMRDPWALHPTLAKFSYFRKKIERYVLSRAQRVSVATQYMAKEIKRAYSLETIIEYNIPDDKLAEFSGAKNHEISLLDLRYQKRHSDSDIRTLVYCGSTPDGFYNLTKIGFILREALELDKQLIIFFVGLTHRFVDLEDFVKDDRVVYIDTVPRRQALIYVMLADYVLFFGHQFDGYLTTKLFEFFALKKRIVPIDLDTDFEASFLIENYGQKRKRIHDASDFFSYIKELG